MRRRVALLVSGALVLGPQVALACPMCFDPRAENRIAFAATAAVMTLLPLGMVGGLLLWLRRRARALNGEAANRNPDSPPPP
ncbi:MAG TPA: hypothetical protein VNL98_03470 [Gemmatimonadales bacterium]|nr:hypothetical protein [Gemmatimonadales bacterium]